MKNKNTIVLSALVIGGVLTTIGFILAFFVAGVPDFGRVTAPAAENSVRFKSDAVYPLDKAADPANFVGYDAVIVTKTATGTVEVAGVVSSADDTQIIVKPKDGSADVTIVRSTVDSIKVHGFFYGKADWGQKIFYFHVPVAIASFVVFLIAAFFAVRFLMTKERKYDTRSRIAMEVSLLFITLTMITGVLWTKAAWGVWWEWEPRLTTYFILMLLSIAYFVLRGSLDDEERRATYGAAFCILAAIDVPISFAITRLLPSTHPVIEKGGLEGPMLASFLISLFGMAFVGFAVYQLRLREELLTERLEALKTALED